MADGILNPIEQLEADFEFDVYTKQEVDALLDEKADKSDTYTKTETDNLLSAKADASNVYTKSEIDTKIPNTVGSATKPVYVNGGVLTECTHELNKTVPANAVFTDTTYTAGNGLNLSGTSFSAKAGTNVTVNSSGINVNGNGTVASADSGLISGGTAYTELRPTLDGTWVKNAQTTAINLQKLEGGIEYLYGLLSHHYDQLKKYINGNYYDYDTDTDSKYTKTVPSGAMPYASIEQIGGRTLVWNQLEKSDATTETVSGVTFTNNSGEWTVNGTATESIIKNVGLTSVSLIQGHKYILRGCPSGGSDASYKLSLASVTTDYGNGSLFTWSNADNVSRIRIMVASGYEASSLVFRPQYVDLTLMYGSGNEPTTVAEFTAQFPANYYAFTQGQLLSAGVTEVVSKGYNLFDKSTANLGYFINGNDISAIAVDGAHSDYIAVSPNQTYYLSAVYTVGRNRWFEYDSNKNLISKNITPASGTFTVGSRTCYIRFNMLLAELDTCVFNVSNSADGTYAPYHAPIQYPIPAEVQALEGYGWSAGNKYTNAYNYIDFERKVFVQCIGKVTLTSADVPSADSGYIDSGVLSSGLYSGHSYTNIRNLKYSMGGTFAQRKAGGFCAVVPFTSDVSINNTYLYSSQNRTYFIDIASRDELLANIGDGVDMYYELDEPIETDISQYLTDDNLISVESGGTLTFPNANGDDYRIPVPSSETYMIDLQASL